MDILNEIIEVSNQMIDTLESTGFFEENHFIDSKSFKRELQIAMQRKWEQENEMILSDDEFLEITKNEHSKGIGETITSLVEKGALNMSVGEDGEIYYSANKEFDINDL
jgi:hypothetical protein